MKLNKITRLLSIALIATGFISCKDGNSIYNTDYEPSKPNPVINSISPEDGYLAGVDSVIVTGENFATDPDSVTINFGGSPGIVKSASKTQLVVRPGTKSGDNLDVRVSVRGAEFFSDGYPYKLDSPFGYYFGIDGSYEPTSPVAVDADNNVYTIINRGGVIRYTRIAPDGTVTTDGVKYPGEKTPDGGSYPTNSTMRFTSYSTIVVGPNKELFMAQQNIRAIFKKTFGDDSRESVWGASSNRDFKIRDLVFDNNGYLWAVGVDSDQIHRFTVASRSETQIPFEGGLSAVAFYANENELYVGGNINGGQKIWKFTIDDGGNLTDGQLYFDFSAHYQGSINSMIFASNGELLVATSGSEGIVRVFPGKSHEALYEGMLKEGAYSITWRDDEFAVVAIGNEDETSLNFLDMYDRDRAGIFGFN